MLYTARLKVTESACVISYTQLYRRMGSAVTR